MKLTYHLASPILARTLLPIKWYRRDQLDLEARRTASNVYEDVLTAGDGYATMANWIVEIATDHSIQKTGTRRETTI